MSRRMLISIGSAVIVIVALIVTYMLIASQHKPEKTMDTFNQAVEDDDLGTLETLIKPDEEDARVNEASLSALTDYLKTNHESYQTLKQEMNQQIENDNFTSSDAQVSLLEDGKTLGMFPDYKLKVKTVNLKVKGQGDNDQIKLNVDGFDKTLKQADEEQDVYEPMLPGEYSIAATVENELGRFSKEEKTDVWGDTDVSFLIDGEKLARNDKATQKEIIDAANQFNEQMSVYVTSGYDADEFKNVTSDLKEHLSRLNSGFDSAKEQIDQIESQFLKSIVNMDELDMSEFDGEWQAEVTMLVDYDEKLKLEDADDFKDMSYQELRRFSLKYDTDKNEWIIIGIESGDADESDIEDWDNKEEIEIEDPPRRKWSEDDSFI